MNAEDIKIIKIDDKDYPELLKEIPDPPKAIYTRGKLIPDEICFAIVGSRLCTPYGKQVALDISANLTEAGITIVSGLAPGIDTAAHKSVVELKKRTIAVLGTGPDNKSIYPAENIKLAEDILKYDGCLISEYPPGTPGSKFTFPKRNRIISGLSLGVLVVEAKYKSGALITAGEAKRQKRKIFAVPGPIYSSASKGTNNLIKSGAKIALGANDILREIDFKILLPQKQKIGKNSQENLIIEALEEESMHIEKIIEKTGLPAAVISGSLAIMEINGKVRNLGGNIYALTR